LNKVATVDLNTWPGIQGKGNTSEFKKKSPLMPHPMEWTPMKWVVCASFFSHIPALWIRKKSNDFCINAYCICTEDLLDIEDIHGKFFSSEDMLRRFSVEFLVENNWSSLGFDICSVDLGISVIYSTKEMHFAKKYKHMWNEYGLIKNRNYCLKLMKFTEFSPHDPTNFISVEIYTNHFAPIIK